MQPDRGGPIESVDEDELREFAANDPAVTTRTARCTDLITFDDEVAGSAQQSGGERTRTAERATTVSCRRGVSPVISSKPTGTPTSLDIQTRDPHLGEVMIPGRGCLLQALTRSAALRSERGARHGFAGQNPAIAVHAAVRTLARIRGAWRENPWLMRPKPPHLSCRSFRQDLARDR